jgi:hypothetical protein
MRTEALRSSSIAFCGEKIRVENEKDYSEAMKGWFRMMNGVGGG